MKARLVPVTDGTFSNNEELRLRSATGRDAACTSKYRLEVGGEEVGYVAIDFEPSRSTLYELWIWTQRRHQGLGTIGLRLVEREALGRGYHELLVRPEPLDSDIEIDRLIAFYESRGYSRWSEDPAVIAKPL